MPKKGYKQTAEHTKHWIESRKGYKHTQKTKEKLSRAHKGQYVSETTKRKISESRKGHRCSDATKRKMGRASKRRWQNSKYKERVLRAVAQNSTMLPTKPERRLRRGLNKLFPKEYRYVGDGRFWIGDCNPDFVNINGQKKIIELFGNYWHSKNKTGRIRHQEENRRIKHFTKYGFETLIVWENELKNIPQLKKRLIEFHNAGCF